MPSNRTVPLALLKLPRVLERTGLSRTELYRLVREQRFPRPVKLGMRGNAWPAHEIQTWIADRMAERDARAAA